AADDRELIAVARLLRARKVFRQTRVLFPTDRGLPAACSVGSIWDLDALEEKLGVKVTIVPYSELTEAVNRTLGSRTAAEAAEVRADELIRAAQKTFLNRKYVVRSCQFHQAVQDLMSRRQCNAFTIECFEFCSSRLPERWSV